MAAPTRLYEAYLFNLDGTVLLEDLLLPGVQPVMEALMNLRRPVRFLSTDTTHTPAQYAEILSGMGVEVAAAQVINPFRTVVDYVRTHHPDGVVYPIAEEPLVRALVDAGVKVSENPAEIDVVIVAYDRSFTYEKLDIAYQAIAHYKRAVLVTTALNRRRLLPNGASKPGTGALVAAIQEACKVKVARNLGTPERDMLDAALADLPVNMENCLLVGDGLATDIRMAKRYGLHSALVLTGETTPDMLVDLPKKDSPEFVLDTIEEVIPEYIRRQMI